MTEDSSQTTAPDPEVSTLGQDNHVTAAAPAADNATPLNSNDTPANSQNGVVPGPTGEGVDDSGTQSMAERLTAYQASKAALLNGQAAAPAAAPAPEAQAAPAPAQAPAPTQAKPAPGGDDEEEFPSAPAEGGRMPKIRLQAVTPVDVQAMAEFKAHQKAGGTQSFVEFVQSRFGNSSSPAAAAADNSATSNANASTDTSPKTVAELDEALKQKKAEKRTARQQFDFEALDALEDEEEALRALRETLLVQETQQATTAQQAWHEEETKYLAKVGAMFPQTANAQDPLVLRAAELQNEWWNSGDPRAQHPSRAFYSYIEAAGELGIQPNAAAPAAQSPNKPSTPSPVHRAPLPQIIASGNAVQQQSREQADTRSYWERKADYLKGTAKASA